MEDPLTGLSRLQLFGLTNGDLKDFSDPSCQDDMDSIHSHLKSIELSHREKHKDLAMTIVDGGVELPNISNPSSVASHNHFGAGLLSSDIPNNVALGDIIEAEVAKDKKNYQYRRPGIPGLEHRRAGFVFKPISEGSSDFVMPPLDLSKVQDPNEYLLAHRKYQNAKKEAERLTGRPMDLVQKKKSLFKERRPVISGRRAIYKPPEPVMISNTQHVGSYQESLEPKRSISEVASLGEDIDDSRIKKNQKVGEVLDEQDSMNSEPFENNAATNLLGEQFQTKLMNLSKMCLPKFRRSQSSVVDQTLPKRREALADVQNIFAKNNELGKSSVLLQDSPISEKSPFSFINSLNKHILHSQISIDPSKTLDIDPFPAVGLAVKQSSVSEKFMPLLRKENSTCEEASTDYVTRTHENNLSRNVLSGSMDTNTALNIINHKADGKLSFIEGNPDQSDCVVALKLGDFGKLARPILDEDGMSDAKIGFGDASPDNCTVKSDIVDNSKGLIESTMSRSFTCVGDCIGVAEMDSHEIWTEDSTRDVFKIVDGNVSAPCFDDPKNDFEIGNVMGVSVNINSNNLEAGSNAESNVHARSSEEQPSHVPATDVSHTTAEDVANGDSGATQSNFEIEYHIIENSKCIRSPSSMIHFHGQPSLSRNAISVDDSQTHVQNIDEELHVKGFPSERVDENSKVKKYMCKRKEAPRRKNLEAAGVRRSTRISSKCLESEDSSNRRIHENQSENVDTNKMDSRDLTQDFTRDEFKADNLLTQFSCEHAEDVLYKASETVKSDFIIEEPIVEKLNPSGQPVPAAESVPIDDNTQSGAQDNYEEPTIKEVRGEIGIERKKGKAGGRLKKEHLRKSLAGAGTKWESGVRRSTRIKSRPLNFWKGERFLYGRIHETLETIIGIKYMSPGKDGPKMSTFTVKSYVPNEYKDLVETAALH